MSRSREPISFPAALATLAACGFHLRGTARKLVVHILVHEVRHWAQAAVVVRQDGLAPPGDHDLCFSESFGPLLKRVGGGGEE